MSFFNRVQSANGLTSSDVSDSGALSSINVPDNSGTSIFAGEQSSSASSSLTLYDLMYPNAKAKTEEPDFEVYKVKKGDTLAKIAKAKGVTLNEIIAANPQIKNPNLINIDQKINIPVKKDTTKQQQTTVKKQETVKAEQAAEKQSKTTGKTKEYKVKKGDTLAKIAKANGVTVKELLDVNPQIKNANLININQKINIPVSGEAEEKVSWWKKLINNIKNFFGIGKTEDKKVDKTETKVANDEPEKIPNKQEPKQKAQVTGTEYTVKKGDTVSSLLRANIGLSEKALKEANPDVNFNKLKAGQQIIIPKAKTLEEAFDSTAANELLQAAKDNLAKGSDKDYCARAVKNILLNDGILDERPDCLHAYQMEEVLDNCDSLEKINVSRDELRNLPSGCVVIWSNVQTDEDKKNEPSQYAPFRKSGHIFITAGDGKEISDHAGRMIIHQTHYAVYVPKKLTTSERETKAIEARQSYVDSKNKNGDMQRKYLNAYINWAKAALEDNTVSQASLKDLAARLEEVPQNNKSDYVKDLVATCNELLPQIQAKIK